jgi:multidrug efflux system membrane fusion protein
VILKRTVLVVIAAAVLAAGGYVTRAWWLPSRAQTAAVAPQAPAQPVITGLASQADVPVQVTGIGTVQPIATVLVKSRLDGQIAKIAFEEGQEVKAGDLLFSFDDRALAAQLKQAEASLARDRAQLIRAQQELKRQQELSQRDYASRQKLEQSQSDASAAEATVRASEAAAENARVQLSYATIRSPIDGRTGSIAAKEGNVVKANDQALVTITQMRPIYVAFTVPERSLPAIRAALAKGAVPVSVAPPNDAAATETGTLTFIDNQVDTATGTIALKATFENRSNALWPGQFLQVTMTLGVQQNAVVVPSAAVQTGQSGLYVFVVKPDSTAEVRPVTVARTQGNVSVISSGLTVGEHVVLEGQLRLATGTRVAPRAAAAEGNRAKADSGS